MSWPSFYGYKYTPIGLRQREVKDEAGAKTFSTTVHLPEGGHLLDIERRFNSDGSVSKRETTCFAPSIPECVCPRQPRTTPRAVNPIYGDEYRPISDLERQADDIIANFRARHGTGIEHELNNQSSSKIDASSDSKLSTARSKVSFQTSALSSKEESLLSSSRQMRRQARNFMDEDF